MGNKISKWKKFSNNEENTANAGCSGNSSATSGPSASHSEASSETVGANDSGYLNSNSTEDEGEYDSDGSYDGDFYVHMEYNLVTDHIPIPSDRRILKIIHGSKDFRKNVGISVPSGIAERIQEYVERRDNYSKDSQQTRGQHDKTATVANDIDNNLGNGIGNCASNVASNSSMYPGKNLNQDEVEHNLSCDDQQVSNCNSVCNNKETCGLSNKPEALVEDRYLANVTIENNQVENGSLENATVENNQLENGSLENVTVDHNQLKNGSLKVSKHLENTSGFSTQAEANNLGESKDDDNKDNNIPNKNQICPNANREKSEKIVRFQNQSANSISSQKQDESFDYISEEDGFAIGRQIDNRTREKNEKAFFKKFLNMEQYWVCGYEGSTTGKVMQLESKDLNYILKASMKRFKAIGGQGISIDDPQSQGVWGFNLHRRAETRRVAQKTRYIHYYLYLNIETQKKDDYLKVFIYPEAANSKDIANFRRLKINRAPNTYILSKIQIHDLLFRGYFMDRNLFTAQKTRKQTDRQTDRPQRIMKSSVRNQPHSSESESSENSNLGGRKAAGVSQPITIKNHSGQNQDLEISQEVEEDEVTTELQRAYWNRWKNLLKSRVRAQQKSRRYMRYYNNEVAPLLPQINRRTPQYSGVMKMHCHICRNYMVREYTWLGICLALLLFPCGIILCHLLRKRRCEVCKRTGYCNE